MLKKIAMKPCAKTNGYTLKQRKICMMSNIIDVTFIYGAVCIGVIFVKLDIFNWLNQTKSTRRIANNENLSA